MGETPYPQLEFEETQRLIADDCISGAKPLVYPKLLDQL